MKNKLSTARKKYFLEPRFQKSLLRYTGMIALLITGVYYLAIQIFFAQFIARGVALGLPSHHVFFSFIREQEQSMNLTFTVTAIFSSLLILGYGLYFSHRVAGPIFKIKNHLKSLRTGKTVGPIHFRSADFFADLAEEINEYSSTKQTKRRASSDR